MCFRTKVSLLLLVLFIGAGVFSMSVQPAEAASLADFQQIIEQLKEKITGLQKRLIVMQQGEKDPDFLNPSNFSASVSSALSAGECSDTDGGIEKYVRGTACRPLYDGSGEFCLTDVCVSSSDSVKRGYLTEYYCRHGKIFSKKIFCKDGCVDGACKGAQEEPGKKCAGEGESMPVKPKSLKCCEGLSAISNSILQPDGTCEEVVDAGAICAYCGNGICGLGENKCNCQEDCAEKLNPVGIWLFEEGSGITLHDESGYGNDGTFNGNPTPVFPNGVYSGTTALQFDGTDDYVEVNGVSDDIATGNFTVEMWFMPAETFDSSHTVHQYLFSAADGFSYNDIYLFLDRTDGTLTFTASYDPYIYCYTSQNSWTANTWYHITAVFDDSTGGKIFVNGVQDGSIGDTVRGTTKLGTLTKIGSQYDGKQNFNGVIDNVRVYDHALSATQVQERFAAGAAI